MTDKKRRIKHLYKTTDEVFNLVKIYKIRHNKRSYDFALDEIIKLGVEKKEEILKQKELNKVEVLSFY